MISGFNIMLQEERLEGKKEKAIEFAKKLLARNRPIEEIMEDTGLTREQVEELKTTKKLRSH